MKPFAGVDVIANANSDESRARERFIMVASSGRPLLPDDADVLACRSRDLVPMPWRLRFLFLISGKREMGSRKGR